MEHRVKASKIKFLLARHWLEERAWRADYESIGNRVVKLCKLWSCNTQPLKLNCNSRAGFCSKLFFGVSGLKESRQKNVSLATMQRRKSSANFAIARIRRSSGDAIRICAKKWRPGSEGTAENSPAFQRWDRGHRIVSPGGTAEPIFQPSLRDLPVDPAIPSVETLGYSRSSLRDYAKRCPWWLAACLFLITTSASLHAAAPDPGGIEFFEQ